MKKLLLVLLALPFIGFGQNDCGDEPKNPNELDNNASQNTPKYKKYKEDLTEWNKCIAESISKLEPVKAKSRLGNQWIYDNTLFYEVIYDDDLNITDGPIDIRLKKVPINKSSYLKGATIKVQKKDGRTRVLVYDFVMGSDDVGSAFGFGGNAAFGFSSEKTYNLTEIVFDKHKHKYKEWIKKASFDNVERGIVEGIQNKAGASQKIINDAW